VAQTIIEGGRLLDPAAGLDAGGSVLVDADGTIAAAGPDVAAPDGATVIDASGLTVLPGLVDLHVHLREPGEEYKETIATGMAAAAAGGFTTVCCMPNTQPAIDTAPIIRDILDKGRLADRGRVRPVAALSKGRHGKELSEMGDLVDAGAVAFSDDGSAVADARLMRHALEYSRYLGVPISVHEEDPDLVEGGVMHEGAVSTELGLRGRPRTSEDVMVARDILLAESTGGHLHVGHVSSARTVELIRRARARGVRVTAEVTPHHLVLQHEALRGYDTHLKVNPPIRSEEDRLALIQGLADGTIDCVATDHAPHSLVEKAVEFDLAAPGMVGLETALGLMLKLVDEGHLTLERVVAALTNSAAACFGLEAGSLTAGRPADLVLVDLEAKVTVDPKQFLSRSRNTPFGGWELPGRVVRTVVGGRTVYEA
jgi:dihydroorotase